MRHFLPLGRDAGVLVLALALAAFPAVADSASQSNAASSRLEIVFPRDGDVVSGGTLLVAKLVPQVPRQLVHAVVFQYSADGTTFVNVLGPAPVGMAEFAALWDTGDLPGGDYVLRAGLVHQFGRLLTTEVRVHVNETPEAMATVQPADTPVAVASDDVVPQPLLTPPPHSLLLSFDGSGSTDPDGEIVDYEWTFDDGFSANGAVVQRPFPALGTFPLSLRVTDDLGGQGTAHLIVEIGQDIVTVRRKGQCGCEKMTVADTGAIVGPEGFEFVDTHIPGIPASERGNLGPHGGSKGDMLPRAAEYQIRHRFEVVATLTADSNPALCAEGQRRQATYHGSGTDIVRRGAKSSDARYDSEKGTDDPYDATDRKFRREESTCAYANAENEWCDDDYHGGGGTDGRGRDGKEPPNKSKKKYDGQKRIVWIDAPGFSPLRPNELKPDGASFKAKFDAKVSGAGGECHCSWEIVIEVDNGGKVLENALQNLRCAP